MMNRRFSKVRSAVSLLSLMAFLFVAFVPPAMSAPEKMRQGREKRKKKMQAVYKKLNLSEDQKQRLEENRRKFYKKIRALSRQIRSKRKQLKEELQKKDLDSQGIERIKDQMKDLQSQKTDLRLQSIIEIRGILTPEQFSVFSETMHK